MFVLAELIALGARELVVLRCLEEQRTWLRIKSQQLACESAGCPSHDQEIGGRGRKLWSSKWMLSTST